MFALKVKEDDAWGVLYLMPPFGVPDENDRYFKGVNALQGLFRSAEFAAQVTGFYLSKWNRGGIRFSYFSADPGPTREYLKLDVKARKFAEYLCETKPKRGVRFENYHGPGKGNLAFRRYLHLMTCCSLDLLSSDLLYCRRLAATYRLEIAPNHLDGRSYFQRAFQNSKYFEGLPAEEQCELLDGLCYWHSTWEDWAHFLVVMLLPGDWIYSRELTRFFNPPRPLPYEIRQRLAGNLLLEGWQP